MSLYLDNAATTYPKPDSVYQAVMRTMKDVGASPGRGGYKRSLDASRIMFQCREAIATLIRAHDSSRIIFTSNATEALNLALFGTLASGDHVVTTSMEHNSLLRPLFALRKQGVEVTIVEAASNGLVDPARIKEEIRPATRLIAVGHVSNVCGAIQPLEEISAISRETGVPLLVDAAQSAGYVPIDVSSLGIDLLAAPGHKGLLGPQGTGFLYVAEQVALRPIMAGGTGTNSTSEEQPLTMPDGFEAGTHNLPGIAGLLAGIEFIMMHGLEGIAAHERKLVQAVLRQLAAVDGFVAYGPAESSLRSAVLSFTINGIDPSLLAAELDNGFDIAVRAGLHCAPRAHRTLGTMPGGTVRLSPGWSTTPEEIAIFSDAVIQCVNKLRTIGS